MNKRLAELLRTLGTVKPGDEMGNAALLEAIEIVKTEGSERKMLEFLSDEGERVLVGMAVLASAVFVRSIQDAQEADLSLYERAKAEAKDENLSFDHMKFVEGFLGSIFTGPMVFSLLPIAEALLREEERSLDERLQTLFEHPKKGTLGERR